METIFITTRYKDDGFERYLGPSLNQFQTKCINIADKPDSDELKTVARKYNVGVEIANDKDLLFDDTIVVYAKPDVHIIDPLFVEKISMIFSEKPEVGVVGVLGTKALHSGRALYEKDNVPLNGIIYAIDEENDKGEHIQYSKSGFYNDIVALDDSVFAVRGSLLKDGSITFDTEVNSGYGIEVAIKSIIAGYEAVVADILVVSNTKTDQEAGAIEDIVKKLGLRFPVTVDSLGKKFNSVVDIEL